MTYDHYTNKLRAHATTLKDVFRTWVPGPRRASCMASVDSLAHVCERAISLVTATTPETQHAAWVDLMAAVDSLDEGTRG